MKNYNFFKDLNSYCKKTKILILGSYHPDNLPTVEQFKSFLIKEGFENTKLATELIKIPVGIEYDKKMNKILSQIENEMNNAEFNIFVFFIKENESTVQELNCFINNPNFLEKHKKTLVLFPKRQFSSMVSGFIRRKKLYIFKYENEFEFYQYTCSFIRRNLIY